jgi:hypothetical protein
MVENVPSSESADAASGPDIKDRDLEAQRRVVAGVQVPHDSLRDGRFLGGSARVPGAAHESMMPQRMTFS